MSDVGFEMLDVRCWMQEISGFNLDRRDESNSMLMALSRWDVYAKINK